MPDEQYISNQIAVAKTSKCLFELSDKLNAADWHKYANLHARPEKEGGGWRRYSNIGVLMKDYANGTGDNATTVTCNISPETVGFLLSRCTAGFPDISWQQVKIFGEPNEQGLCTVTKLFITRNQLMGNGQVANSPWQITCENGFGIPVKNANGGQSCQSGSYQNSQKATMRMSDEEFYRVFKRADSFIRVFEDTWGPHLFATAKAAIAAREKAKELASAELPQAG